MPATNSRACAAPAVRRASAIALATALFGSVLGGCASTRVDAQWQDRDAAPTRLTGQRVLVVCEAYDTTVRQLCSDRLADEVTRAGATPTFAAGLAPTEPGRPIPEGEIVAAARQAGAVAAFATSVEVGTRREGSGLSIGLGGFGIGSGGFGGGVGISAPIGGRQDVAGYLARGRLLDTGGGRLVWSARASASPSNDINGQLLELTQALVGAAGKAGYF